MRIKSLYLNQYRNYLRLEHHFGDGLNLFYGNNGAGKTNLLESIYYLSHFSSFRTQQLEHLSRNRQKHFSIRINYLNNHFGDHFGEHSREHSGRVDANAHQISIIQQPTRREITLDEEKYKSIQARGKLKVMLFTVRDIDLVLLSPGYRRDFIDHTLSIMKDEYHDTLVNYQKMLKLRNQKLKQGAHSPKWDEMIIPYGSRIIHARNSFLKAILPWFKKIFQQFSPDIPIDILYRLGSGTKSDIVHPASFQIDDNYYQRWLDLQRQDDLRTGFTHFGPHADDYLFQMRGDLSKNNSSQGEMRLLIYCFKLAIYEYFKQVIKQSPVLLLDDVFNDFDEERIVKFFSYLNKQEQIIIACANKNLILPYLTGVKKASIHRIDAGKIFSS